MKWTDVKSGMKLRLVNKTNTQKEQLYKGLKIGDILTVGIDKIPGGGYSFEDEDNDGEGWYIDEKLSYCWKPQIQTLKELIK